MIMQTEESFGFEVLEDKANVYLELPEFAKHFDMRKTIPLGRRWLEDMLIGRYTDDGRLLGIQISRHLVPGNTTPKVVLNKAGTVIGFVWLAVHGNKDVVREPIPVEIESRGGKGVRIEMYSRKDDSDTVYLGELHIQRHVFRI
ncbi:hypothetical protein HKX48_001621 [Thoreauomyces humboldtii]|nr:hypothetical protein HKX48_001621 [Thoreauomyces humboldtii]